MLEMLAIEGHAHWSVLSKPGLSRGGGANELALLVMQSLVGRVRAYDSINPFSGYTGRETDPPGFAAIPKSRHDKSLAIR
jgi:hypothetical protein